MFALEEKTKNKKKTTLTSFARDENFSSWTMASKRKASAMASALPEEPVDPADELMFLCLGGGNEVGRSSHIIQYKGKTVMVSPFTISHVMILWKF